MSSQLMERVDKVLNQNELSNRHSYFQLKYFVIGKQPTVQSKLWQCLRELKARRDAITAINLEIAEIDDRLALIDIDIEKIKLLEELIVKEKEIKIRQLLRKKTAILTSLSDLHNRLKVNQEEATFFLQAFESLEKVEKYKGFDDLESQKEYWNEELSQQLNMRMLLRQPLDSEMISTILALNNDSPVKKQVVEFLDMAQVKMLKKE